jgi:hypothetical protein
MLLAERQSPQSRVTNPSATPPREHPPFISRYKPHHINSSIQTFLRYFEQLLSTSIRTTLYGRCACPHDSSIDKNFGPCDILSLRTCKKQNSVRNVPSGAHHPRWTSPVPPFPQDLVIRGQISKKRSIHHSGYHSIDSDTSFGEAERRRLGEGEHHSFGSGIPIVSNSRYCKPAIEAILTTTPPRG